LDKVETAIQQINRWRNIYI